MKSESCPLDGVRLLTLPHFQDSRGEFVKIHHADWFREISFRETYYSRSNKGVVRGMHFQYPPHHHWKLVTCMVGAILDVCVDMRTDSATCGKWMEVRLTHDAPRALLLPPGIAHGFLAESDQAVVLYQCSTVQEPASEGGVHWQSFGCPWPVDAAVMSDRDRALPTFEEAMRDSRCKEFSS